MPATPPVTLLVPATATQLAAAPQVQQMRRQIGQVRTHDATVGRGTCLLSCGLIQTAVLVFKCCGKALGLLLYTGVACVLRHKLALPSSQ